MPDWTFASTNRNYFNDLKVVGGDSFIVMITVATESVIAATASAAIIIDVVFIVTNLMIGKQSHAGRDGMFEPRWPRHLDAVRPINFHRRRDFVGRRQNEFVTCLDAQHLHHLLHVIHLLHAARHPRMVARCRRVDAGRELISL